VTLRNARHRPAIDLKMVTEIPSEIRRSIDDEAAWRDVIGPKISATSLRNGSDESRARKNQHKKNIREDEF